MAKNHYTTKSKRRNTSGKRRDTQRAADTMRELKLREQLEKLAQKPDSEIDLSDIPEITDWSKSVVNKFHRGVKT